MIDSHRRAIVHRLSVPARSVLHSSRDMHRICGRRRLWLELVCVSLDASDLDGLWPLAGFSL